MTKKITIIAAGVIVAAFIAAGVKWYADTSVSLSQSGGGSLAPVSSAPSALDSEDAVEFLARRAQECLTLSFESVEQLSCYHEAAWEALDSYSFAMISEALAAFQAQPGIGPGVCHDMMHHISAHYYERVGDFYAAFGQCPLACTFSCFHGVAMAHLALTVGSGTDLITQLHLGQAIAQNRELTGDVLLEICDPLRDGEDRQNLFGACANGLGHALPTFFKEDIGQALDMCVVFGEPYAEVRCQEGVFHKVAFSPEWINAPSDEIFSLCDEVSSAYHETCYGTMVVILGNRFRDDTAAMAQACASMPQAYRRYCYRMLGVSAELSPLDARALVDRCGAVPEGEVRGWCVGGLIRAFSNQYGPHDIEYVVGAANEICALAGTGYAAECYSELGRNIGEMAPGPGSREELCGQITSVHGQEWCRKPAM